MSFPDERRGPFSDPRWRLKPSFVGFLAAMCLALGLLTGCSEPSEDADTATREAAAPTDNNEAPANQDIDRETSAASGMKEGQATTDAANEAGSDTAQQADAVAPQAESGTQGGDGSEITLNPLSESDLTEAALPGELGCQFVTAEDAPLLVAMGNVGTSEAARGVVKVGDYVETVAAPGGFDGMLEGTAFNGKGKTVEVAVTGPASGDGESPPRPATLTYQRADGAEKTYDGQWQCGP